MSLPVALAVVLLLLLLSGTYSGSETGVYSLSRLRLDAEAREGKRSAQLLRGLLRDDAGLLVTLLIGNNLMLELLTHAFEVGLLPQRIPEWMREVVVALVLTPVVFLFGELLPKDVFRRRPHRFLAFAQPVLWFSRLLYLPLVWPLRALSALLEHVFRLRRQDVARALGREEMLEILQESTRTGALAPHAEELARNVLVLRETPVSKVMVPWGRVRTVDLGGPAEEVRAAIVGANFTRLPALRAAAAGPQEVVGYVHQLDVLGAEGDPGRSLRPIPTLPPEAPIDRALARLRLSGQRLALVGDPGAPLGLVSLMDLMAAISGPGRQPPHAA